MAETTIKWLHSGGPSNKNPNNDLGGSPSAFEIALNPNNNLFSNVTPEQAETGYEDYRCFYIYNYLEGQTLSNVTLMLSDSSSCGTIAMGALMQDEQQLITISGMPADGGYLILQTEFGPPFTCPISVISLVPSWGLYAGVIQTQLRNQAFCDTSTVTLQDIFTDPPGASFLVTFTDDVGNKSIRNIKLLQNNLTNSYKSEYRLTAPSLSTFNSEGASIIQVTNLIDPATPLDGIIHTPSPYVDFDTGYLHLSYISWTGSEFTLEENLDLGGDIDDIRMLNENDEVWVEEFDVDACVVDINKVQPGYPVGQMAQSIGVPTDVPIDWQDSGGVMDLGIIRPKEGAFVWVKRTIDEGQDGCKATFDIGMDADVVEYT